TCYVVPAPSVTPPSDLRTPPLHDALPIFLLVDPNDVRAAKALIPLYEKDEKWSRLPALYELLLSQATEPEEKIGLLTRLVEVTGRRLGDRRAAAAYARRAYEIEPTSVSTLELFEEASRAAGAWEAFVETLSARPEQESAKAPDSLSPAEPERKKGKKRKRQEGQAAAPAKGAESPDRRVLELKLARVYAEELARVDDAVAVYKRLLERDPGDATVAAALESILRTGNRRDDLRWLLELRIETAKD